MMHTKTFNPAEGEEAEPADRQRRIAWQAERIAEARASVAAGLLVSADAVDAWIASLGTDHELPAPRAVR